MNNKFDSLYELVQSLDTYSSKLLVMNSSNFNNFKAGYVLNMNDINEFDLMEMKVKDNNYKYLVKIKKGYISIVELYRNKTREMARYYENMTNITNRYGIIDNYKDL